MVLMSVCHTVIPEKARDTDDIIYHASSPGKCKIVFYLLFLFCTITNQQEFLTRMAGWILLTINSHPLHLLKHTCISNI